MNGTQNNTSESEYNEAVIVQNERTVYLSSFFIGFVGFSQEELYRDLIATPQLNYIDICKEDDGSIKITVTEQQINTFVDYKKQLISELQLGFSEYSKDFKIIVNDSYTEVDYYFDPDYLDIGTITYYLFSVAGHAGYVQLFSGVTNGDDFTMILNIYNSHTGKLVISHDINNLGEYLYTEEDWAKSYE